VVDWGIRLQSSIALTCLSCKTTFVRGIRGYWMYWSLHWPFWYKYFSHACSHDEKMSSRMNELFTLGLSDRWVSQCLSCSAPIQWFNGYGRLKKTEENQQPTNRLNIVERNVSSLIQCLFYASSEPLWPCMLWILDIQSQLHKPSRDVMNWCKSMLMNFGKIWFSVQ
jgi:hypothetical protein